MRDLRISRGAESPITLEEWVAAVNKVDGVRLTGGNTPRQSHSGNAEVYAAKFAEWVAAFRWTRAGEAVFNADDGDAVVHIAFQLARVVGARVIDSNGAAVSEASLM
jgi:hypothetical protein